MSVGSPDGDEVTDEAGVSISWKDIAPAWLIELSAIGVTGAAWLASLEEDPVGTLREIIAEIIVGWVLDAFAWTAGAFAQAYNALADSLDAAFFEPLGTAFAVLYEVPLDLSRSIEDSLVTVLEPLGLAAPFAMLLAWGLTATITAAAVWVVWGIIETYLPVESIVRPVRTVWDAATALIPGGDR